MSPETFLCFDVEADGPVPGRHSMLSLGAVAFQVDRTILGTFSRNLKPLEGAGQAPETMAWWAKQPEAWAACQENPEDPKLVMADFMSWAWSLPGRPSVLMAAPMSFDWLFLAHYLHTFTDYVHAINRKSPFRLAGLDLGSFAMAVLNIPFSKINRPSLPASWKADGPAHTHCALDDAMGHALSFCAAYEAMQKLHQPVQNVFVTSGSTDNNP